MCEHESFLAKCEVARLTSASGDKITGFVAELRVQCADCGQDFQFRGLPAGYGTMGATCSVDALTANLAIVPAGTLPSFLDEVASKLMTRQ